MENNKKLLKIVKIVIIVVLWAVVIYGAYQGVGLYQFFQVFPQKQYETVAFESLPEEALVKISMYNQLINTIYVGLLFVAIYLVVDYFYDPENHFITTVYNFASKHMEDDKDEKK